MYVHVHVHYAMHDIMYVQVQDLEVQSFLFRNSHLNEFAAVAAHPILHRRCWERTRSPNQFTYQGIFTRLPSCELYTLETELKQKLQYTVVNPAFNAENSEGELLFEAV